MMDDFSDRLAKLTEAEREQLSSLWDDVKLICDEFELTHHLYQYRFTIRPKENK